MLQPVLELTQQNVWLTIDCPLCDGTARAEIPERWGESPGLLTCEEDRGGCGGAFELSVTIRDPA
ncbi:hypothetical protein HLRTI_001325 [Halorhabdus tiamatea SARL4B]|uniref:Uncharacterized protein n=1 Tax=Halorhabdus tiamatea SARL4B TaxID=1033806 RepID=U2FEA1_9EURY|nr:hypothetical protein HLRTI_001325 [Halorhabdus tiamatea SARL4B]